MPDLRPKWAIILDELIEIAERELVESKKGAIPTAPANNPAHPPHPAKARGDTYYEQ